MEKCSKIYCLLIFCLLYSFAFSENIIKEGDHAIGIYSDNIKKSSEDLIREGLLFDSIGDKNKAIALYSIIIGRYNNKSGEKEKKIIAKAANAVGIIYSELYNYSKALKMYLWALDICDEVSDYSYKTYIYNNIGVLYSGFKEFNTAMTYFEKFFEYQYEQNCYEEAGDALSNMISSAINALDTVALSKYLIYAQDSCLLKNQAVRFAEAIGYSFLFEKRLSYKESLAYAFSSEVIAQDCGREYFLCAKMLSVSYQYIGNAFLKLKQYDSACIYIEKSLEIAAYYDYKDIVSENYRRLANIAKDRGRCDRYQKYTELYLANYDTLYSIGEYGNLKDIVYGTKLEHTENEIYKLQDKDRSNSKIIHLQSIILIGAFVAIVLILVFLIILYKQKKELSESYESLFRKNKEILEADEERAKIRKKREVGENIEGNKEEKNEDGEEELEVKRYSSSSLNEDAKSVLIADILGLMDSDIFLDSELTLESFAITLNSNTRYVSQVINERFDKNFTSFINEYRVKAACKLFNNPLYRQYTIEAIAQKVGFKNRTNFNPVFKKYTGITPSQYLKMCSNS